MAFLFTNNGESERGRYSKKLPFERIYVNLYIVFINHLSNDKGKYCHKEGKSWVENIG